jgi:hypothetical protein
MSFSVPPQGIFGINAGPDKFQHYAAPFPEPRRRLASMARNVFPETIVATQTGQ